MGARRTYVATGLVALLALAGITAAVAADPPADPPPKIAFLANGIVPADALAAGPIAGQLGAPVFTTQPDDLSTPAAEGLDDYDPELVIVLGGPVAIQEQVLAQVSAATGLPIRDPDSRPDSGIVRAAGEDRFETARIVATLLSSYDPAYLGVDLQALDAAMLEGREAGSFAVSPLLVTAFQEDSGSVPLPTDDVVSVLQVAGTYPDECGDGTTVHQVVVRAVGSANLETLDEDILVQGTVTTAESPGDAGFGAPDTSMLDLTNPSGTAWQGFGVLSVERVIDVASGETTFYFRVRNRDGDTAGAMYGSRITAMRTGWSCGAPLTPSASQSTVSDSNSGANQP